MECLRDKYVWEIKKNTKVQQRLLSETNLTYAKTVKLARAMELAQEGVDYVSGTGTKIPIYGTVDVCVSAKRISTELPVTIVSGSGPTLLGRNWHCN